jgi:prepilin-type N-terminal cleavage/methylation domain-containing protein
MTTFEEITRFCRRTRGFTVLELLVVISVVAVLCAVVLPAVQHAREAARQIQCKNNLHQIGVALHAYQTATNCFPSGWIIETPVERDSKNGWGWLAMLLPEMEQGLLFNSINFNHHVGNLSNQTGRLTVVSSFLCPTDHVPAHVPFYDRSSVGPALSTYPAPAATKNRSVILFEVAGASYAGVFGPEDPGVDRVDAIGLGVFFANSRARAADLVDGASQTLVVGERSARRLATTWTGMHQDEEEGAERVVGFTQRSPNDPSSDEAAFSSRHLGGVHFLLGDGSVRFLSEHLDSAVYEALSTRAGHELIGRSDF